MSDAGWNAVAQIVGSVCSLIAALLAGKAWKQGQTNERRIAQHEEASAARAADIKATQPAQRPFNE